MMIKARTAALALSLLGATALGTGSAHAFGEAGPMHLAQFGYFLVNTKVVDYTNAAGNPARGVTEQMFVEFMVPVNQIYPYPVVLVHGGGGQATDWMATVDGRDGWINYLVNAGFAVYWIDRPGTGRSVSNNTYGNGTLGNPANPNGARNNATSENWPDAPPIYDAEGNLDRAAWIAANDEHPMIVAWSATSPTTPFASNDISIAAQVELLQRIGPAIVFTHSAGGTTAGAAAAIASDNVVGLLAYESGGADPYGNSIVNNSRWSGAAPVAGERTNVAIETGMCSLQTATEKSQNLSFADIRVAYLYSRHGQGQGNPNNVVCRATQARESGVEAIGVLMHENEGGQGSGHFAQSELTNGEIAVNILVPILAWMSGAPLPDGFVVH